METYDYFIKNYKVNDYVIIKGGEFVVKITKRLTTKRLSAIDENDISDMISDDEIVRKATPEEIETFEMNRNANKYNL